MVPLSRYREVLGAEVAHLSDAELEAVRKAVRGYVIVAYETARKVCHTMAAEMPAESRVN